MLFKAQLKRILVLSLVVNQISIVFPRTECFKRQARWINS